MDIKKANDALSRSPYAFFFNEKHMVVAAEAANISTSAAEKIIEEHSMNELDFTVLRAVNTLMITNSKQAYDVINVMYPTLTVSKQQVERAIMRLTERLFLTQCAIISERSSARRYAYSVNSFGRRYLDASGVELNRIGYIGEIALARIKAVLSANQAAIAFLHKYSDAQIIPNVVFERRRFLARALHVHFHCGIKLFEKTFCIESVRRQEGWDLILSEKLRRLRSGGFLTDTVTLLIVCEDSEHIAQTREIVSTLLPAEVVLFVHDREVHEQGIYGLFANAAQ